MTGYCDNYVKKLDRAEIDVNLTWLEKRLGKHLTNEEIQGKLEQLGFDVSDRRRQHACDGADMAFDRRYFH